MAYGHRTQHCLSFTARAGFEPVPPTPLKDMEAVLGRLEAKKDEWARLGMLERAELLRQTLKCVIQAGTPPLCCCLT